MENNQAISKINKIGKAGSIVALIIKIFLIIGLIGCFIGFIAVMILPKNFVTFDMNGSADVAVDMSAFHVALPAEEIEQSVMEDIDSGRVYDASVSYGDADLAITDVQVDDSVIQMVAGGQIASFSMRDCAYAILAGMVYILMSFITVMFAGFLAKAFANCRSPFDTEVIRKMKHFAYSLIPWTVISCIVNACMSKIFSGNLEMNFSINFSYVFIVLVILALAYIFQYGAMLQKEADETL